MKKRGRIQTFIFYRFLEESYTSIGVENASKSVPKGVLKGFSMRIEFRPSKKSGFCEVTHLTGRNFLPYSGGTKKGVNYPHTLTNLVQGQGVGG